MLVVHTLVSAISLSVFINCFPGAVVDWFHIFVAPALPATQHCFHHCQLFSTLNVASFSIVECSYQQNIYTGFCFLLLLLSLLLFNPSFSVSFPQFQLLLLLLLLLSLSPSIVINPSSIFDNLFLLSLAAFLTSCCHFACHHCWLLHHLLLSNGYIYLLLLFFQLLFFPSSLFICHPC